VIYAAASRALCALEVLANAGELADDYVVTPIEVPDELEVKTLSIESLPSNWGAAQAGTDTADIGTAWAERLETAILVVPSAIIPRESNYLLNPRHPEFSKIRFLTPEPFTFDARLSRSFLKRPRPSRKKLAGRLVRSMEASAGPVKADHFSSLVEDEGGASDVEGASRLPVSAACDPAPPLEVGSSRASRKVFFTSCQKLFVKTSFISVLAFPS
jgi:hypothetical protein